MKKVKENWKKRMLAAILTGVMIICQLPVSALAEESTVTEEVSAISREAEASEEQPSEGENSVAVSTASGSEETGDLSGESAPVQGSDPVSSSGEETGGEEDGAEPSDSEGTAAEDPSTSSEDASLDASVSSSSVENDTLGEEESSAEAVQPLAAATDAAVQTTAAAATQDKDLAWAINNSGSGTNRKVVQQSDGSLEITDGDGLIWLSQVKPEEYANKNITLKITGSSSLYDLTGTVTVTEGDTSTSYSYLGLGSSAHPYAGTFSFAAGSEKAFRTRTSLFQAVSTDAVLPDVPFSLTYPNVDTDGSKSTNTEQPLFIQEVTSTSSATTPAWNVTLTNVSGEDAEEYQIGGVIGTLSANAKVSLSLENNLEAAKTLACSSSDSMGLFCREMKEGSQLTASLTSSGSKITVTSTNNGNAGGYVGQMNQNSTLTVSGSGVNTVTSNGGNAGGLVGSATDATIQVTTDQTFSLSEITVTAGSSKSAGGFVGEYTKNKIEAQTLTLSNFYGTKANITLSGGSNSNVGGVFGLFKNSGSYTISNGSVTSNLTAGTNYGGLIGKYEAQANGGTPARNAALTISNITGTNSITSTGGSNATTYGGVIGTVSGSSYVAMDDVSVSTAAMPGKNAYFGGLVGKMEDGLLNVGNVTLTTTDSYDISADDVGGRGGLVGAITKGVLRLHGTTDLTNQKITTAYHHTGQIVGNNGNGLVYATGTGSNAANDGTGWTLKRYSGNDRSGSDIGNWGEVVRLDGSKLKETTGTDASALFVFDQTNHTVTVQGADVTSGTDSETGAATNTVSLAGIRDFAAYALAFNLNSGDGSGILSFQTNVNPTETQNVILSGPVDLTGTGILGIGRDDMSGSAFSGTFDGGNTTITLDIGSKYGDEIDENSGNGSG